MKAVLISIQPQWCELITSGKKTVEIRKTKPTLDPPFKVYIYCTVGGEILPYSCYCGYDMADFREDFVANGNVIGEFVCDEIKPVHFNSLEKETICALAVGSGNAEWYKESCVSYREAYRYLKGSKKAYAWHISDLKIYDEPKDLHEFMPHCRYIVDDIGTCNYRKVACNCQAFDYNPWPDCSLNAVTCKRRMQRPPQSWCYVHTNI